jgi:hypothetical protein
MQRGFIKRKPPEGLLTAFARLPFVDAFRNELAVPSGDILGTFAALQDVVYTS